MRRPLSVLAALVLSFLAASCARRDPADPLVLSGHVEATETRVSTKIAGRLDVFTLEEGDEVAAGALVARLDDTDARLALDVARAELAQAEADLELVLAGSRGEDVREAEAAVDAARVRRNAAQVDLDRMQALLDQGVLDPRTRDNSLALRNVQDHELEAALERLARVRAGSRPEEIARARARVATAEAQARVAEQQVADCSVVASASGVLTEKLAEPGERLARDAGLFVLTDLRRPWLTAWVGEMDLTRVKLGEAARVSADDGTEREGRVTWISPRAEFTPKNVQTRDERAKLVYRVKIALPNDDGVFKPGMPAEARVLPEGARP